MEVVVNRSELQGAFQAVSSVVGPRTTKPILQHVKLIAEGDRITLLATDLEVGIREQVDGVKVVEPGEGVAPADRMGMILRESTDEELTIAVDEHHCTVSAKGSQYKMLSEDPAEFPEVPGFEDDATFTIAGDALASMIRRTVFATDVETTRYALNGVLFDVQADRLCTVATDGRRMALVKHKLKDAKPVSGIVPSKALSLIDRSIQDLDDKQAEVSVALRSNDLLVKTPKAVVYARLVEGRFPKYQDVLPSDKEETAKAEVAEMLSGVRRSAILTSDSSRGVTFTFEKGALVLTSRAVELGESTINVPIDYDGKQVAILFNPQFLVEPLRVLAPDGHVDIDLVDGEHAAVMRSGSDYIYVIMPLASQQQAERT